MALSPAISVMTVTASLLLSYTLTSSTCIHSNLRYIYFPRLHDRLSHPCAGPTVVEVPPASAFSILHGLGGQYNCLEYSRSVEADICEAVRYIKMVAERGNGHVQYNYGVCHENDEGVGKDTCEAARYFKMPADQSYAILFSIPVCSEAIFDTDVMCGSVSLSFHVVHSSNHNEMKKSLIYLQG